MDYSVEVDSETVNQDFDDVDLYGEKLIEDEENERRIEFE